MLLIDSAQWFSNPKLSDHLWAWNKKSSRQCHAQYKRIAKAVISQETKNRGKKSAIQLFDKIISFYNKVHKWLIIQLSIFQTGAGPPHSTAYARPPRPDAGPSCPPGGEHR
jgi:hypothetical protein